MKEVSVVIPTYNRADMVCRCIDAVLASRDIDFEVVVVDDASPDDTAERISTRFGADARVRYLRNEHNSFQAVSRNRGAANSSGRFVFFLDDDNLIAPDLLHNLRQCFLDDPKLGLAAPVSIHRRDAGPDLVWTLGSDFNRWTSRPMDNLPNSPVDGLEEQPARLPTTYSPNAFMVPRAVFDEIHGFDESFVAIFEESDFGWRIMARGYTGCICTSARTTHCGFLEPGCVPALRALGIERPGRTRYFARNRLWFAKRHFPWYGCVSVCLVFAPLSALWYGATALRHHRPDIARAYLAGTLRGIFSRPPRIDALPNPQRHVQS